MEIKVKREELLDNLGWMQSVVDRKTTMPILSNVLLEAKANSLTLAATDLQVGVIGYCQAEVGTAGKVAVPARELYNIVRELPDEIIQLKQGSNNWVSIQCGKSKFKLIGRDPSEFPAIPKKGEGEGVFFDSKTITEMLDKVSFAISTDETRFNLNGVFLETGSDQGKETLNMVATDGHRLSVIQRPVKKKIGLKKGVIFPRKGVAELRRLLETEEGEFNVYLGEKQVVVESGSKTLSMRLIDGQYPPYQQVIPKNQGKVVVVLKEELVQSLRRVSVVNQDRTQGVQFSISPGNLEISSNNPDVGEAKEELQATYKGGAFTVGFNARYFLEALGVIGDEKIVLQLNDNVSPCLIQSEVDRGFTHVIMPMRI